MTVKMDLKERAEKNSGSGPVRAGFELDRQKLARWMEGAVEGFSGPLAIEQFNGGQSNPTYKLSSTSGTYVLRSKPVGELVKSAHAVDREYRVMTALGGTDVPVPKTYAMCSDDSVIGRWFYVMGFTPGVVIWDLPSDRWTPAQRRACWSAGVEAASRLHRVDFERVGLGDFGKRGGYVARQMRRWAEQYEYTRDGIDNPAMDHLIAWLRSSLPQEEPTAIVHGDLQLSNMIQHPDLQSVAAIIDWELSTLGNPISDFAYYCRDYHVPVAQGGYEEDPESFGIPPEQEIKARYQAATGLTIGEDWSFYIIFNMFRLAAIRQGVAKRIKEGTAVSANANVAAQGAVTMADNAWRLARQIG
jgi:aminoglycoside phosphotransferase (APT) family kinase protein